MKQLDEFRKYGVLVLQDAFDPTEHQRFLAKQQWVDVGQNALYPKFEVDVSQYLFASLHTRFGEMLDMADEFFGVQHYRYRHQDKKFTHRKSSGKSVLMHIHTDVPMAPPDVEKPDSFTTMLVYINDGYKGGKLVVHPKSGRARLEIQPRAGSIIMFDGNVRHGVSRGKDQNERIVAVTHVWRL